ncbi:hypothetical protein SRB17_76070 [Streptomyces sp. RB17]|nr:hypothetical protein [Streptomyces sp. RB17]
MQGAGETFGEAVDAARGYGFHEGQVVPEHPVQDVPPAPARRTAPRTLRRTPGPRGHTADRAPRRQYNPGPADRLRPAGPRMGRTRRTGPPPRDRPTPPRHPRPRPATGTPAPRRPTTRALLCCRPSPTTLRSSPPPSRQPSPDSVSSSMRPAPMPMAPGGPRPSERTHHRSSGGFLSARSVGVRAGRTVTLVRCSERCSMKGDRKAGRTAVRHGRSRVGRESTHHQPASARLGIGSGEKPSGCGRTYRCAGIDGTVAQCRPGRGSDS